MLVVAHFDFCVCVLLLFFCFFCMYVCVCVQIPSIILRLVTTLMTQRQEPTTVASSKCFYQWQCCLVSVLVSVVLPAREQNELHSHSVSTWTRFINTLSVQLAFFFSSSFLFLFLLLFVCGIYKKIKSETELTASVLKKDPKHTRD